MGYILGQININLDLYMKFSTSSRSTMFKDIIPKNISQMFRKTTPIRKRIVISCAMKKFNPSVFKGKSMETETKTWSGFPKRVNTTVEQILGSVRYPSKKVNHLSNVAWDRRILSVPSEQVNQSLWWKLVSKVKYISRKVDWENLAYIR